jgi:hypothetical protein
MHDSLAPVAKPSARAAGANLTGAPLALARGAWIVTTVVSVGLQVAAMPLAYQQIITPHTGPQCADLYLSAAQLGALHAAGVSSAFYANWIIAVQCYSTLVYVGVAALLFWRRSDNRMALLAATALVLIGTSLNDQHWLGAACALRPTWPAAALLFQMLGALPLGVALFFVFPSGKWVPRWSPWLILCFIPITAPSALLPPVVNDFWASHPLIGTIAGGLGFATLLFAQVYRYQRVSTPVERLQTKWVVLGSGLGLGGIVATFAAGPAFGLFGSHIPTATSSPVTQLYVGTIITLCFSLIPISIGIALLRSHLFDVDTLINRVLVYGSLTGVLALLYFGGVIALQGLVGGLTGQTQPVIVVVTTLAIAALAQPLRRALQRGIDRRFYRRKYDAARTLAAFSATLRDEVDLARLREDLLAVVDETMKPQHVSLWLPAAPLAPTSEPAAGE